jgi:hypothetical protein
VKLVIEVYKNLFGYSPGGTKGKPEKSIGIKFSR